jgi:peptidyl-prolyl cis-trans isomerase D
MLQNIRENSQGWIAKTIIGVIVVLLSLTGFDAILNVASHREDAAQVNGETISKTELSQMVELQRRQLIQQLGKDFDPSLIEDNLLRDSALKSLIDRMVLLQGAQKAGLAFSTAAMDQMLLTTPEFQIDGQFSAARFDQFVRERGMNRFQFRKALADEILIAQQRAGIAATSFVTDEEVEAFIKLEKQTRDFATLTLAADAGDIQLGDDEIKAYYDEHSEQFMSPEQVVLEYVELKKDGFFDQVEVNQEELQELYQREVGNLAEQRKAAHILIEVGDKQDSAQAKAKIEALSARLAQGEDFAVLAKEASDDIGSKEEGGDLGFAGPGVYEASFEEALYALKKGEVSAPVETAYGWHLIKLLDVQAPEVPSFESLKDKLVAELKNEQVESKFVAASKVLADSAFEASDLAQPAQELGLTVKATPVFGREGGNEGILANRQVLKEAFSPEVLEDGANSGVIELDPNTAVVVRVKEHKMPEKLALEQVAESIRSHLSVKRAAELASQQGEQSLKALREGNAVEGAWQAVQGATRSQEGQSPRVLQAVFRMPKPVAEQGPEFAGVQTEKGDYVLIRLNSVSQPETALSEDEKAMFRRSLASRAGEQDYNAFREQLKHEADIERF